MIIIIGVWGDPFGGIECGTDTEHTNALSRNCPCRAAAEVLKKMAIG